MREEVMRFVPDPIVTTDPRVILEAAGGREIHAFGGTYDWLHRGHTAMLTTIANFSNVWAHFLVGLVPDDEAVEDYKGYPPDAPAIDRATAVAQIFTMVEQLSDNEVRVGGVFIHGVDDQPPERCLSDLNVVRLWKGKDYYRQGIHEVGVMGAIEAETGVAREMAYCDHGPIFSCDSIRRNICSRELLAEVRA